MENAALDRRRPARHFTLLPPEPAGPVVLMVPDDLALHLLTVYPARWCSASAAPRTVLSPGLPAPASWDGTGGSRPSRRDPPPWWSSTRTATRARPLRWSRTTACWCHRHHRCVSHLPDARPPRARLAARLARAGDGRPGAVAATLPRAQRSAAARLCPGCVEDRGTPRRPGARGRRRGHRSDQPARRAGHRRPGRAAGPAPGRADLAVRLSVTDADRLVDTSSRVLADVPEAAPYLPSSSPGGARPAARGGATRWTRAAGAGWPGLPQSAAGRRRGFRRAAVRAGGRADRAWLGGPVGGRRPRRPGARARALGRAAGGARRRRADDVVPRRPVAGQRAGRRTSGHGHRLGQRLGRRPQGLDLLLCTPCGPWPAPTRPGQRGVDGPGHTPPARRGAGGRAAWADHDLEHRRAIALAAVVLCLRNRSCTTSAGADLERHLAAVARGPRQPVDAADAAPATGQPLTSRPAAPPAAHSGWRPTASWVKASQTVVLPHARSDARALLAQPGRARHAGSQRRRSSPASGRRARWSTGAGRAPGGPHRRLVGVATGGLLAALPQGLCTWLAAALNARDGGAAVIRGLTVTLPCLAVAAVTNELLRRRLAFAAGSSPTPCRRSSARWSPSPSRSRGTAYGARGRPGWCRRSHHAAGLGRPCTGRARVEPRGRLGLLSYGGPYAGANLLELVQLTASTTSSSLGPRRWSARAVLAGVPLAFMPT